MPNGPKPEDTELALILERLGEALALIRRSATAPEEAPAGVVVWADEAHVYVEATLEAVDDHVDLCLHSGRLFLAASR